MSEAPDPETPGHSPRSVWPVLSLLFAALMLGGALGLRQLLEPEVAARAPLVNQCDLHRTACSSQLPDGGTVTLSILPHPIPVMQPLTLTVGVDGVGADRVTVDFVGVNMDMGLNRVPLTAEGKGRYTGTGILPVCVRDLMVWDARVLVALDDGLMEVPFRFETRRDR
jgi:hypothetical protein